MENSWIRLGNAYLPGTNDGIEEFKARDTWQYLSEEVLISVRNYTKTVATLSEALEHRGAGVWKGNCSLPYGCPSRLGELQRCQWVCWNPEVRKGKFHCIKAEIEDRVLPLNLLIGLKLLTGGYPAAREFGGSYTPPYSQLLPCLDNAEMATGNVEEGPSEVKEDVF